MKNSVLLVGSIPGDDAAAAMRLCAEGLGDYIECMPDGETGKRRIWINYLAATTYDGNANLATVNRPIPVDPKHPEEWRAVGEDWAPRGYADHWQFRVRDSERPVRFEDLGYAAAAKDSYADFCDLRDAGVISPQTRFMVALPLTDSAVRPFVPDAADFEPICEGYREALAREVINLTDCIPANDLVVQWDICMEVVAVELRDGGPQVFPWELDGDPLSRYVESVAHAAKHVPERVLMGLHLCYGDLGHRHVIEPRDLSVVTEMAAAAIDAVDRTIDYFHMPVPRDRGDDEYFAPLSDFDPHAGKLYLGLIHRTGGIDTSRGLVATAKQHFSGFGVATECGFGRRPLDTIPELLEIHRTIADELV